MDYKIRKMAKEEYSLLEYFLYEAIFVPEGMPAPPKSIINQPELQVYVADFGKKVFRKGSRRFSMTGKCGSRFRVRPTKQRKRGTPGRRGHGVFTKKYFATYSDIRYNVD